MSKYKVSKVEKYSLRKTPDSILRKPSDSVKEAEIVELATIMSEAWDALGKPQGLAAVQIGVLKRVIVCRFDNEMVLMFNPELLWSFGSKKSNEACESEGKDRYIVKRPRIGKVKWTDSLGATHEQILTFKKLKIVCHELNHCEGILLSDIGTKWKLNKIYHEAVRRSQK